MPSVGSLLPRVYRLHERLVAIRTEYNLRLKSGSAPIAQVAQPVSRAPRQDLDDVTLRYLQDLLAWVEENQRRVSAAELGADLPTVESQLGSHRGLHQSVEEFRAKIERARADEVRGLPFGSVASSGEGWQALPPHTPGGMHACTTPGLLLLPSLAAGPTVTWPTERIPGLPGQAGLAVRQAAGKEGVGREAAAEPGVLKDSQVGPWRGGQSGELRVA